jgi:hypothetical protein
VLGLAQQIRRDHGRIPGVVGDDHHLGGAGQQVDANPAEELPLRLRDVHVPGPDDHVDRLRPLQTERQRGQRLDPADTEDLGGSGGVHRPELRRIHPSRVPWRSGGRDTFYPRHLRGSHRHDG